LVERSAAIGSRQTEQRRPARALARALDLALMKAAIRAVRAAFAVLRGMAGLLSPLGRLSRSSTTAVWPASLAWEERLLAPLCGLAIFFWRLLRNPGRWMCLV